MRSNRLELSGTVISTGTKPVRATTQLTRGAGKIYGLFAVLIPYVIRLLIAKEISQ